MKTRVIWTKNEVFGHVPELHLLVELGKGTEAVKQTENTNSRANSVLMAKRKCT